MSKGFAPILIVILIALAVGGYLIYQKQTKSTPISQSSPTPVSSSADITNWKTYTNTKYGFSFQYPVNLDSSCCNISGALAGNPQEIIILADITTAQKGTDASFNGIAVNVISNQKLFNVYIEEEKKAQLKAKQFFNGSNTPGTQSSFTLDNVQGVILRGYSWDDITRYYIPFPNSQHILVIAQSEQKLGSFEKTFNQILSTFKFSDQLGLSNISFVTPDGWGRIDCDQSVNFSPGDVVSCATEPNAFAINVFTAKYNEYENQEVRNDSNNIFSNYRNNLTFDGKKAIQYDLKILWGQPAGLYKYTTITLGNNSYLNIILNDLKYDNVYRGFLKNIQFQ